MKKLTILFIISFLFVSMLLGSDIDRFEQEKLFQQQNSLNAEHIGSYSTPSRDAGDILFQFNPPMSPWGVGYDGEFLWLSDAVAGDTNIYQYATDGTATGASLNCPWMGSFLGDMTNSPGFIYIVNVGGDNNIYKIDEVTGNVEEIIAGAWNFISARGLAYDPDANEFYIGGWNHTEIYHIDATGATIGTFPFASVSGLAWHPMGNNGAGTLFVTESAPTNNIYEVDPTSGAIIQQFTSPGADYACAGLELDSMGNLWAIDQGTNTVYNIDSGVPMGDPGAPAAPTDFAIVPDPGGALSADLSWVCPTLTIDGSALIELDEMLLYRGEDLIYVDTSPTIGGAGSYTDVVPGPGNYSYSVLGVNSQGEGIPASIGSWIGEDVPNVVEDLLLVGEFGYGHLTWTNPTTGLNGGAFNNPILGYHIERNDGAMFEVTGILTEFWDTTIPGANTYYYNVTAYNAIGDGGVAVSNTALLNAGGTLVMEDFSTWLPAGWTTTSTSGQINWAQGSGNNAGGIAPEAQFSWSPSTVATQRLISPVLDTSGETDLALEFKHSISDYNGQYALYVQTTSDGTTWNDVLVIPPVTIGATTVTETVTTPDVGSATFQIAWVFDGDSYNINYWYVDDVMLIGTYTPPDPGYITGTVTLEGGTGDVEDVQVTAAYMTVNPDATGFYEIEIFPGTFDVTATLDGYEPDMVENVAVTEGATTSDVDLLLEAIVGADDEVVITTKLLGNYPNPFNPVTNIAYSINETGNVTIDVYNLKGQLVKSLLNEVIEAGDHIVTWSGRDSSNKSVASGVYFYKMKSSNFTATKKMILMK